MSNSAVLTLQKQTSVQKRNTSAWLLQNRQDVIKTCHYVSGCWYISDKFEFTQLKEVMQPVILDVAVEMRTITLELLVLIDF